MVVKTDDSKYLTYALIPKKETGVHNFLVKYPEYDGRGTVIAILDSGVDPAAGGMQVTTDGKPKVIERYNCTGGGDVDMTKKVEAQNFEIKGLTGRTLKIPTEWKNPTGIYRIGLKCKYELLSKLNKDNLTKRNKEKFIENYKAAFAVANAKYQKFEKATADKVLTRNEIMMKESLEAEIEVLNNLTKKYYDAGPAYDCILFHDGTRWCAVVDTTEQGNLAECKVLFEYGEDPTSYAFFSHKDKITYSINVHDDGDILEIVTCSSIHGTHVASIAAANFPDCSEKNGIAPGAQIISLCIGDSRLDSVETGTGIARAMIRIMRNCEKDNRKVHVINMSYGEHAHWSNAGHLGELMNKVIDKYGVVWVVSGSNRGPALFTIGVPPDISTTNLIGVGAYISTEFMSADCMHFERPPGMAYSWSSRGPTLDGCRGITVLAPGAAITSVPPSSMVGCKLLNGTSMASPHVAGALALLISGLLARKINYTPYSIKRAISNTACYLDTIDSFAQGHGLLQAERAFEYLLAYHSEIEYNVRFHITCGLDQKGIIQIGDEIKEHCVTVEPVFFDDENIDPEVKIGFRISLAFTSDSWIQTPKHLEIYNMQRSFFVKVDSTLAPEGVSSSVINAYDANKPEKGPVFNIDITIIKPLKLTQQGKQLSFSHKEVILSSGIVKRHFITVPENCSYAIATIESPNTTKVAKFIFHALEVIPKRSCSEVQFCKYFSVNDEKYEPTKCFRVRPGYVLEIALTKYWASPSVIPLNYTVTFATTCPALFEHVMHHGQGIYQIDLKTTTPVHALSPTITLKRNVTCLKPSESTINVLTGTRDIIPPKINIYELVLVYNFSVAKLTEIIPNNAYLSDLLYESAYESQLWLLFDSNKKFIAAGDAYPEQYSVKLEKGDYVVRHQIRHDRKEMLEKLSDLPMLLDQKLHNSITLDAYYSRNDAMTGKKVNTFSSQSSTIPMFVHPLPTDKLPKNITPGQYYRGSITFINDETIKKTDSYEFKYILTEYPKKTNESKNMNKLNTKLNEYQDALRDFLKAWLLKFDAKSKDAEKVFHLLHENYSDNPSIYTAMIQNIEPDNKRNLPGVEISSLNSALLDTIISLANEALKLIDQDEILKFMGTKNETESDPSLKTKPLLEQKKATLIEALARKGVALCQLHIEEQNKYVEPKELVETKDETTTSSYLDQIDNVWKEMIRFSDPYENKNTMHFAAWYAAVNGNYGSIGKALLKLSEEKTTADIDKSFSWVFSSLNYLYLKHYFSDRLTTHYPPSYMRF